MLLDFFLSTILVLLFKSIGAPFFFVYYLSTTCSFDSSTYFWDFFIFFFKIGWILTVLNAGDVKFCVCSLLTEFMNNCMIIYWCWYLLNIISGFKIIITTYPVKHIFPILEQPLKWGILFLSAGIPSKNICKSSRSQPQFVLIFLNQLFVTNLRVHTMRVRNKHCPRR